MPKKQVGGSMRHTGQGDSGMYPGCLDSENRRVGVPKMTAGPNSFFGPIRPGSHEGPGLTTGAMLKSGMGRMPRRNPEV